MKYIYLNLSIALNVASYLVYKSISNKQQSAAWFLIFTMGLLLGGLNVFFFTKALKYIRLNIAYPIFSGACIFIIPVNVYKKDEFHINLYIMSILSIALNVASYLVYKSISNKQQSAAWFLIFTMGLLLGGLNVFFFTKALKYMSYFLLYCLVKKLVPLT
jgi:multidrug transporter EmrE-like cation transporter